MRTNTVHCLNKALKARGDQAKSDRLLALAEAIHRQELIASNNGRIAEAVVCQGRTAEALPYARRAVEIYLRLGHPDLAGAQAILAKCGG